MNFKIVFLILLSLGIAGCTDNDDQISPDLEGTWRLSAVYYDPGDGSGDFVSVNRDKELVFLSDGTVRSNGNLCDLSETAGEETTATYDAEKEEIYVAGCQGNLQVVTTLRYVLNDLTLDIYYQCIEGCAHRYRKVAE